MRHALAITWMAAVLAAGCSQAAWATGATDNVAVAPVVEEQPRPTIQVALLLDTSGSMSGLLAQAKSQLWKVVNEFATMKYEGQRPVIQVALFEYGHTPLGKETGYMRMILPLTTNLDKVSEELFALKTNGGDEYCGQVIRMAVDSLAWSDRPSDLKAIFIAGNEGFNQGTIDPDQACKAAIAKGIVVNTIFCGPHQKGINTRWKTGADLADGSYMSINQNSAVVHVAAPQDKEITRLSQELNETYVAYGKAGDEGKKRQDAQDANANTVGEASTVERAVTKASEQYRNDAWDLVDAVKDNTVKLEDVKADDLPEPMKNMSVPERKEFVKVQATSRARIQQQINDLNRDRSAHVARKQQEAGAQATDTLQHAVVRSAQEQAERLGYAVEKQ